MGTVSLRQSMSVWKPKILYLVKHTFWVTNKPLNKQASMRRKTTTRLLYGITHVQVDKDKLCALSTCTVSQSYKTLIECSKELKDTQGSSIGVYQQFTLQLSFNIYTVSTQGTVLFFTNRVHTYSHIGLMNYVLLNSNSQNNSYLTWAVRPLGQLTCQ